MHESTYQCNQRIVCMAIFSRGAERMSSVHSLSAYMLIVLHFQFEYEPCWNELVNQYIKQSCDRMFLHDFAQDIHYVYIQTTTTWISVMHFISAVVWRGLRLEAACKDVLSHILLLIRLLMRFLGDTADIDVAQRQARHSLIYRGSNCRQPIHTKKVAQSCLTLVGYLAL